MAYATRNESERTGDARPIAKAFGVEGTPVTVHGSVAEALDVPISSIMREVGDRLSVLEGLQTFPDIVPDDLVAEVEPELSLR